MGCVALGSSSLLVSDSSIHYQRCRWPCRRSCVARESHRSHLGPAVLSVFLLLIIAGFSSPVVVHAAPARISSTISKPARAIALRSGSSSSPCDEWFRLRYQWESSQTCYSGSSSCCKLYDDMLKTIVQLCSQCVIDDKDFFAGLFHRYCVGSDVPATALPPCTVPSTTTTSMTTSTSATTVTTATTTSVHTGNGGGDNNYCVSCSCPTCSNCQNGCEIQQPPPCTSGCTTAPPPCTSGCTTPPPPCTSGCTTAPPCTSGCTSTCPSGCTCNDGYCSCTQQRCDASTPTTPPTTTDNGDGSNNSGGAPAVTGADCIHGSASVTIVDDQCRRTQRLIRHLRIGDSVLTSHSSTSSVFMFTHRDAFKLSTFLQFSVSSNASLAVTEGHFLHTSNGLVVARNVRVGQRLAMEDGKFLPVVAIHRFVDAGLYNPQTLHGDIVVNGFLVSTYTQTICHPTAHSLLAPLRAFYRISGVHISSFFP